MIKRTLSIAAGLALLAASAHAQVLLDDSFNTENGGATQLNYNAFANWDVLSGSTVDLIGPAGGGFGLACVTGSCVDMSGSTGSSSNGNMRTKNAYSFAAGDVMTFQLAVSGNQRNSTPDGFAVYMEFASPTSFALRYENGFGATNGGPYVDFSNILLSRSIAANEPYHVWFLELTASEAGDVKFGMQTGTTDNIGPLIDNVLITRRRAAAEVPEPASVALLMAGLLAIGASAARRRLS